MQGVPGLRSSRLDVYAEIASNRRRTLLLIALFVVLIAAIGYLLGELYAAGAGLLVLPLALVLAGGWAAVSYFAGDRMVLGMSRARAVTREELPVLYDVVESLAIGAGLPMPALYVIDDEAPNAFATGRDPKHASVAITSGLLARLDRDELQGVLAHELSHVRNQDTRLMLLVIVMVGVVALLSDVLLRGFFWGRRGRDAGGMGLLLLIVGVVAALLTPLAAQLVRLAISRQREYLADASGALLTRYPPGLARALRKIAGDRHPLEAANKATAPLYIVNPLHDAPHFMDSLFDTHPPIEERIARLEAM